MRKELVPGFLILVIALVNFTADLVTFDWDWDIDHMMYFGGRLLAGDLHWTVEFDDKLAVVQALFLLPAWAHSIRVWQVMSALAVIAGCVAAYVFLVAAIREQLPDLSDRAARAAGFYTAVLMGYLFVLLPGGITHINPLAASLAMIAIAFADTSRRAFSVSRTRFLGYFMAGALCASLAIGIRPYFLYPLVLTGLWVALKVKRSAEGGETFGIGAPGYIDARWVCVLWVLWVACVGFFGLAVNALPYLITGQLDVLWAGLMMLAQDLAPRTVEKILRMQGNTFGQMSGGVVLVLVAWAVAIIGIPFLLGRIGLRNLSRHTPADISYLLLACPLLLEATILGLHFWAHYFQLFVPFIALALGFFLAYLVACVGAERFPVSIPLLVPAFLIILLGVNRADIARSWSAVTPPVDSEHPQGQQLAYFEDYLRTRPATRRDFLYPSHMYFHWKLGEPRRGFPHAANTEHIVSRDWWQGIEVPEPFNLPTNYKAYCRLLESSGPSLVVADGPGNVTSCFDLHRNSKYRLVRFGEHSSLDGLLVFERAR